MGSKSHKLNWLLFKKKGSLIGFTTSSLIGFTTVSLIGFTSGSLIGFTSGFKVVFTMGRGGYRGEGGGTFAPPEISRQKCSQFDKSYVFFNFKLFDYFFLMEI